MKNPIKKKILHTISDDWSKMKTIYSITFFGITIFKSTIHKTVNLNVF